MRFDRPDRVRPSIDAIAKYRATLDRIPDTVVLRMIRHDFDFNQPGTCICGWALREAIAGANADPSKVRSAGIAQANVADRLAELFGGTTEEWLAIYWDVTKSPTALLVEIAFRQRVDAAQLAIGQPLIHADMVAALVAPVAEAA